MPHWSDSDGPLCVLAYTDGSANLRKHCSGTAIVLLIQAGACLALFGIIGEQIAGNDATPWGTSGTLSLQAEQVAAATAVLWVLQLRTFIPRIEGETKFDCMAAGLTADGTWAAGDFMGTKLHQLTTVAQATERVTLSLSHVKGHSNDPWNDLADYIAKASAKGQATWPAPPPATCSAVMQPELAWLPCRTRCSSTRGHAHRYWCYHLEHL